MATPTTAAKAAHTRLEDIQVNEVSLVDAPANKRRFLIVKRDKANKDGGQTSGDAVPSGSGSGDAAAGAAATVDGDKAGASPPAATAPAGDAGAAPSPEGASTADAGAAAPAAPAAASAGGQGDGGEGAVAGVEKSLKRALFAAIEKRGAKMAKERFERLKGAAQTLWGIVEELAPEVAEEIIDDAAAAPALGDVQKAAGEAAAKIASLESALAEQKAKSEEQGKQLADLKETVTKQAQLLKEAKVGSRPNSEEPESGAPRREPERWPRHLNEERHREQQRSGRRSPA